MRKEPTITEDKREIYTEEIHVKRLKVMLEMADPCGRCPASFDYSGCRCPQSVWHPSQNPCVICQKFIGLKQGNLLRAYYRCPCHRLGEEEAIRLTIKAIEEYERKNHA